MPSRCRPVTTCCLACGFPVVEPAVTPVVFLSLYLSSNGRARRGTGGTLNRQSAIAGLNSLLEVYGCGV